MGEEVKARGQAVKFVEARHKNLEGEQDLWLTPPSALKCLYKYVTPEKFPRVWECSAGPPDNRPIVSELRARGFEVHETDILDGEEFDLYTYEPPDDSYDLVLTNPPFSGKTLTLQRMLSLAATKNKAFCLLFPIMALDSLPFRNMLKFHGDRWGILCPGQTINFINYKNPGKKSRSFFSSAWFCYNVDGIKGLQFE